MKNFFKTFFLVNFFALVLTACIRIPYRMDIDQGNVINQSMLSRLQIGMKKEEVKIVLGSPLLSDIFHKDRWDYVQFYENGKTQKQQKGQVSLFFSNGLLSQIKADKMVEIKTEPLSYSK